MAVNPSAFGPCPQFMTSAGAPAVGTFLFFYTAGTTTKANTYTSSTGITPNSNPITLNSLGQPPNEIWWPNGSSFKMVWAPSTDTDPPTSPIRTWDNLFGINDITIAPVISEWVLSTLVPTYLSATSFSLPGNQTAIFTVDRRLKTTNSGGTVYSSIVSSVFGATTIITVLNDGSSVLDSGLATVSYGIISTASSSLTLNPTFTSINSGPVAGDVNIVVNGNGLVQQLPVAPTLTAALQYGLADMHLIGVTGGTGVSGTVGVFSNAGFSCGVGYGAIAASWTTGQFIHKHRMTGNNTKKYNGKTITISGKIYQDTGGSRSITVSLGKPTTTLDTFSAVTNLGTSSSIAVPSATMTPFSFTITLGATDASLGLETLTTDTVANTVVNKNYVISDLYINPGSVATLPAWREYEIELPICKFYLPVFRCTGSGSYETLPGSCTNFSAAQAFWVPTLSSPVRARLTGVIVSDVTKFSVFDPGIGLANTTNVTSTANGSVYSTMVTIAATITAIVPSIFGFRTTATANDYIALTGAQL